MVIVAQLGFVLFKIVFFSLLLRRNQPENSRSVLGAPPLPLDIWQVMAMSRPKALAELRDLSLEELRAFSRFLCSDCPRPELAAAAAQRQGQAEAPSQEAEDKEAQGHDGHLLRDWDRGGSCWSAFVVFSFVCSVRVLFVAFADFLHLASGE